MSAALTVAVAMFVGLLAQGVAQRARVPGIVLLLALGAALGPDAAGIIEPRRLGGALEAIVGFGVAVILFEGGLQLDLDKLRRESTVIRRLVTLGAVVTAAGGAVAAWAILGWDWPQALLFGTLVVVTGPTVIGPLLRRIKVKPSLATILAAEGVFIDAVGAFLAVAGLELVLSPGAANAGQVVLHFGGRLAVGGIIGGAAGVALWAALRMSGARATGLANVFSLASAILAFEAANAVLEESGLAAAIVAGVIVGSSRLRVVDELASFKEQLTQLFIGMLFVLLAADVRLAEVAGLGWGAVGVVAALMLVVRPVAVWVSSAGTGLGTRDKLFLSWLAPRGIVAAAVASWFAHELGAHGVAGGDDVRALVFFVIAVTVTVQGLTGGLVARLLGVSRRGPHGYVIVGANRVALTAAACLRDRGREVVLVDTNPDRVRAAEEAGFRIAYGNALREHTLLKVQAEDRLGCAALTANEGVNYIFAGAVRDRHRGPRIALALSADESGVTAAMARGVGGVAFGRAVDVGWWHERIAAGDVAVERWRLRDGAEPLALSEAPASLLPLVCDQGDAVAIADERLILAPGDSVDVVVDIARALPAESWLRAVGLEREPDPQLD